MQNMNKDLTITFKDALLPPNVQIPWVQSFMLLFLIQYKKTIKPENLILNKIKINLYKFHTQKIYI
jgi:hypothetical protein